jgi:hypothetical protein
MCFEEQYAGPGALFPDTVPSVRGIACKTRGSTLPLRVAGSLGIGTANPEKGCAVDILDSCRLAVLPIHVTASACREKFQFLCLGLTIIQVLILRFGRIRRKLRIRAESS